jgi:hypothetical protein
MVEMVFVNVPGLIWRQGLTFQPHSVKLEFGRPFFSSRTPLLDSPIEGGTFRRTNPLSWKPKRSAFYELWEI